MTLALLLTAVGGAWAADTYTITFKANNKTKTIENVTLPHTFMSVNNQGNGELDLIVNDLYNQSEGWCVETPTVSGNSNVTAGLDGSYNQYITISAPFEGNATVSASHFYDNPISSFTYTLEISVESPSVDVKWDAATKTGTFVMPAFDVEIAPIYAPAAQWAVVETVPQLPTAAEGIYAESTDSIVTPGTVAKGQGTLMYAVGTSATEVPALTAFSATLPKAEKMAAGDYYVWYYIKGADTPEGQDPTAENTFNDSEICTTPLKVTVLNNKFDIQFNAANANTIEAGKATVKVGDAAAEVKEGKLKGVKKGSKVTVAASEGYKIRKAAAKKQQLK